MKKIFVLPILAMAFYACASKGQEDTENLSDSMASPLQDTLVSALAAPDPEVVTTVPVSPDYDTSAWTELTRLDSTIRLDLRYATTDNFVAEKMYDCGRCFFRPAVARAVQRAHQILRDQGYGLQLFDCYRPRPIQWKLWEKMPDPRFVTDPEKGSMHNRGAAADLTLTDSTGRTLEMGTPFDYFGREAYHAFTALPDSILQRRKLLKETMESQGFRSIRTEWWHYSFQGQGFALSDMLWKCYE